MTRRTSVAAMMLAATFGVAATTACTEDQRQDLADQAVDDVKVTAHQKACEVESKVIVAAYETAAKARAQGLDKRVAAAMTTPFHYFVLEDGPTTKAVERDPDTLGEVPESACGAIPTDKVPVGSE